MSGLSGLTSRLSNSGLTTDIGKKATNLTYDVCVDVKRNRNRTDMLNERARVLGATHGEDWPVPWQAELAIGFVPFAGPAYDIVKGIKTGNPLLALMGVGFLVADALTFGGASLLKGSVKAGITVLLKTICKEGFEKFGELAAQQVCKTLENQISKATLKNAGEAIAKDVAKSVGELASKGGAKAVTEQTIKKLAAEAFEKALSGSRNALSDVAKQISKSTENEVLKQLKLLAKKSPKQIEEDLVKMGMAPSKALQASESMARMVKNAKNGEADELLKKAFEDVITKRVLEQLKKNGLLDSFEKTLAKELKNIDELKHLSSKQIKGLESAAKEGAEEGLENGVRKAVKKGVDKAFKRFEEEDLDLTSSSNGKQNEQDNKPKLRILPNERTVVGTIPLAAVAEEEQRRTSKILRMQASSSGKVSASSSNGDDQFGGVKSFLVSNTSFYGSDANDYKGGLVSSSNHSQEQKSIPAIPNDGTENKSNSGKDVISLIPAASGKNTLQTEIGSSTSESKASSSIKV